MVAGAGRPSCRRSASPAGTRLTNTACSSGSWPPSTRESRPAQNDAPRNRHRCASKSNELQQHQTIARSWSNSARCSRCWAWSARPRRQTEGRLRVIDCRVVDLQATEVAESRSEGASHAGTVTLVGVALDSPTVAEFHDGLMRSGLFADVKLIKSNERTQLGPETVRLRSPLRIVTRRLDTTP